MFVQTREINIVVHGRIALAFDMKHILLPNITNLKTFAFLPSDSACFIFLNSKLTKNFRPRPM